jgi:hypothetical protein
MGNPAIGSNGHCRCRYLPTHRTMPHASKQRLEDVSGPDNNAHQAECERHTGPQPAPAETHIAQYVATSISARIQDVQTRAGAYDRSHRASCHQALNEGDFDCTSP